MQSRGADLETFQPSVLPLIYLFKTLTTIKTKIFSEIQNLKKMNREEDATKKEIVRVKGKEIKNGCVLALREMSFGQLSESCASLSLREPFYAR